MGTTTGQWQSSLSYSVMKINSVDQLQSEPTQSATAKKQSHVRDSHTERDPVAPAGARLNQSIVGVPE